MTADAQPVQPPVAPPASAPDVSVIIPCYKQAHFLPGALESVFSQTHAAVEAVVVNDGSPDDADAVARSYGERIRYVSQANAGLPAARNAGIAASSGKYLLFLDADDLLPPEAVARALGAAAGREDVLVVSGWRTFATGPTEPLGPDRFPAGGDPFPRYIHDNIAPPNAYLTSRALIERLGRFTTDRAIYACEDWDMWLRIVLSGAELVAVPHVGAYYRVAAGSMSSNRPRMLETRTEVLMRTYEAFRARPDLLAKWGSELATAAKRVRRRLRAQNLFPEREVALTRVLSELAETGARPEMSRPEALLAALLGRESADRLMMSAYRRFDHKMYAFYLEGHA